MQRLYFLLTVFFLNNFLFAQSFKILHYTETSGFDHQTRSVSHDMFQQLGMQYNFTVDNDSTGDSFSTLSNLQQYSVIVFANTTGDAILDSTQRSNFENYIAGGGNVIGIHSAADTYRHSSANGTNTGVWDYYAELIGASVQQNPNHVTGTPFYNMHIMQMHPLLNGIPDPWYKAEEYYYWQFGYFDSLNNNILMMVDSTVGPNGMVNSYDSARATAWFKILPSGNRIFYTSLGHAATNYTDDTLFINLIRNAILWTAGVPVSVGEFNSGSFMINSYPNPFDQKIFIQLNFAGGSNDGEWQLCNSQKQIMMRSKIFNQKNFEIDCKELPDGIYFLKFIFTNHVQINKLFKIKREN
ncbi:MAG TPA: ThuA domain-containing protein [Bacteroidia bacterium]|nr:ThuA domain-containing protein [Bacteroidia bacterium]